jgi:hypothetical protein
MSLVPDDLKNEWKDKALLLNDSDGGLGVKCTLIFEGGIESTSNVAADSIGAKPRVGLSFGGRSSARTITGQENTDDKAESGEGLREVELEKVIEGRVYAVTKDFDKLGITASTNKGIWTLITKKEYIPDLHRCKEVILYTEFKEKRISVKMLRPPQPYGLGQAVQCKSFWEEV